MTINVYTGRIKVLSDALTSGGSISTTAYEYIEFDDGRMIRKLSVHGGLESKLRTAAEARQPVELHVSEAKKKSDLLALKTADGKLFANDLEEGSTVVIMIRCFLIVVFLLAGFVLSFVTFGVAMLLACFGVWELVQSVRQVVTLRQYVRVLPNVITI